MFFTCSAHFLNFAFEASSIGVATYNRWLCDLPGLLLHWTGSARSRNLVPDAASSSRMDIDLANVKHVIGCMQGKKIYSRLICGNGIFYACFRFRAEGLGFTV